MSLGGACNALSRHFLLFSNKKKKWAQKRIKGGHAHKQTTPTWLYHSVCSIKRPKSSVFWAVCFCCCCANGNILVICLCKSDCVCVCGCACLSWPAGYIVYLCACFCCCCCCCTLVVDFCALIPYLRGNLYSLFLCACIFFLAVQLCRKCHSTFSYSFRSRLFLISLARPGRPQTHKNCCCCCCCCTPTHTHTRPMSWLPPA